MLQQILRDLYVDPEILAELDDQQKQTLFCRMREEQVRRWKAWDEKTGRESPQTKTQNVRASSKTKKTVSFMRGVDGEPWVWVMGEHENDRTIEEILRDEAREKARKIAEKEAEELRKRVEEELRLKDVEIMELSSKIEDIDIYCSVDELKEKAKKPAKHVNNYSICHYQNKNKINLMDREVLQEISLNKNKVQQGIALWEKRMTEERTCEIFRKIQKKQMEVLKEAEENEKKQEHLWIEQERKAKQAEQQIREIARKAREEHRLSVSKIEVDTTCYVTPGVPPGKQAVVEWYKSTEILRKAGLDASNRPCPWFHGLITRKEAESLLMEQSDGSFLVRLSEKIWGYAVSYRAKEKCKHYLVNATQSYCFLGNNQIEHKTLGDLITHHHQYPLTGGEKLKNPCPRDNNSNGLSAIFDNVSL